MDVRGLQQLPVLAGGTDESSVAITAVQAGSIATVFNKPQPGGSPGSTPGPSSPSTDRPRRSHGESLMAIALNDLLETLRQDYARFPKDQSFEVYDPDVFFQDPLTRFQGRDRYQK